MNPDRLRTCDERFRTASEESLVHLWPKVELWRRKQNGDDPSFAGEYYFEKTVADRVPDCFIIGGPVNRWIEFVAGSPQEYRAKTREALRLGFVIHWVFCVENTDQIRDARDALTPELRVPYRFGSYDPDEETMDLGDPITYKNYEFVVDGMHEFNPDAILGYRSGAASIGYEEMGHDLGLFSISGYQYRLLSRGGEYFRAVVPGESSEDNPWGWPTKAGLKRVVEAGAVTRLGPVK